MFFSERKHKKCYYKTLCNTYDISTYDISYKIWVSQSSVAKDSSLLWCDTESYSKWLLTFQRIIVPSSSGFSRPRRFLHALLDPSHWQVMNHSCHDAVSQPRRLVFNRFLDLTTDITQQLIQQYLLVTRWLLSCFTSQVPNSRMRFARSLLRDTGSSFQSWQLNL